jgi:hypothetical protein
MLRRGKKKGYYFLPGVIPGIILGIFLGGFIALVIAQLLKDVLSVPNYLEVAGFIWFGILIFSPILVSPFGKLVSKQNPEHKKKWYII